MNESVRFTRTHEDTAHPPPNKVADWSLQCQRRSSKQGERPNYSSSLHALHKRLLCLGENRLQYVCDSTARHLHWNHIGLSCKQTHTLNGVAAFKRQISLGMSLVYRHAEGKIVSNIFLLTTICKCLRGTSRDPNPFDIFIMQVSVGRTGRRRYSSLLLLPLPRHIKTHKHHPVPRERKKG